jgi:hypothetical protein
MANIEKINHGWRITSNTEMYFACFDDKFYYIKGKINIGINDIGNEIKPILFERETEMEQAILNKIEPEANNEII